MNVNNGRTDDDELLRPFEDSEAFIRMKENKISFDANVLLRVHKQNESLVSVDSSLVSQIEQDKKKIQLLQQDLLIEKEYNAELNQQLQDQMD